MEIHDPGHLSNLFTCNALLPCMDGEPHILLFPLYFSLLRINLYSVLFTFLHARKILCLGGQGEIHINDYLLEVDW